MTFARFMATPTGRILRIVLGIAIIWIGYMATKPFGYVLEFIGLIPVLAGLFNICLIGRFIGAPLRGSDLSKSS